MTFWEALAGLVAEATKTDPSPHTATAIGWLLDGLETRFDSGTLQEDEKAVAGVWLASVAKHGFVAAGPCPLMITAQLVSAAETETEHNRANPDRQTHDYDGWLTAIANEKEKWD